MVRPLATKRLGARRACGYSRKTRILWPTYMSMTMAIGGICLRKLVIMMLYVVLGVGRNTMYVCVCGSQEVIVLQGC